MRRIGSACVVLLAGLGLSGCVSPAQFEREGAKTRADFETLRDQERARAAYEACAERALPGSAENLQCQLEFTKKADEAPKP